MSRVIAIQGSFDDALRLVRELVERRPLALLNSINPYRLEGQKTIMLRCSGVFYDCGKGSEARRFNRMLMDAGYIKGF